MIYSLENKLNSALILSGGVGQRMNIDIPKQFLKIDNKLILEYSLDIFCSIQNIDEIIIVCHKDYISKINYLSKKYKIVLGGANRTESSFNGLKNCDPNCTNVIIHDAARPFCSSRIINEGLSLLNDYDAAIPILEINDSLIENIEEIKYLQRDNIKIVQTPQFFRYKNIFSAYNNKKNIYNDDLSLLLNHNSASNVKLFRGSKNNFKITSYQDYQFAKELV